MEIVEEESYLNSAYAEQTSANERIDEEIEEDTRAVDPILSILEANEIAAVLEDCADQCSVLAIGSYSHNPESSHSVVGDEISRIIVAQRQLEQEYEKLQQEREEIKNSNAAQSKLDANDDAIRHVARQLRESTELLCRSLKQNPGAAENILKVNGERKYLQDLMQNAALELRKNQSFQGMIDSVAVVEEKKAKLTRTILKEEQGRKSVKVLRQKLKDLAELRERSLAEQGEIIAQLKDQLQEIKARTALESKYVKKEAQVSVAMTQKKTLLQTKELDRQTEIFRQKIQEENIVNIELETYLKESHKKLSEKVNEWMTKYETDTDEKQTELDNLKADRARDLSRLQELTEKYEEYYKVVEADQKRKDKLKEAAKRAVRELAATIKIQAWWRGLMVRHQLGPFKPQAKKPKAKKKK